MACVSLIIEYFKNVKRPLRKDFKNCDLVDKNMPLVKDRILALRSKLQEQQLTLTTTETALLSTDVFEGKMRNKVGRLPKSVKPYEVTIVPSPSNLIKKRMEKLRVNLESKNKGCVTNNTSDTVLHKSDKMMKKVKDNVTSYSNEETPVVAPDRKATSKLNFTSKCKRDTKSSRKRRYVIESDSSNEDRSVAALKTTKDKKKSAQLSDISLKSISKDDLSARSPINSPADKIGRLSFKPQKSRPVSASKFSSFSPQKRIGHDEVPINSNLKELLEATSEKKVKEKVTSSPKSPSTRKISDRMAKYRIPKHSTAEKTTLPELLNVTSLSKEESKPKSVEEAMEIDADSQAAIEEMDWEVNELRKEIIDNKEPSFFSGEAQNGSQSWAALVEGGEWILVIDTNVYISALPFVEEIIDSQVPGLGYPVIYVPHRVLCELDALKNSTKHVKNPLVPRQARMAVSFVNSCLTKKHPRLKGQTLQNYIAMTDLISDADDKIILSCIQIKLMQKNHKMILLSNDVNLRNKALVEDIETYSVTEFEKTVLGRAGSESRPVTDVKQMNRALLLLRIKAVLKLIFQEILEETCGNVHLSSVEVTVESFIRHWPLRFQRVLPVPAEEQLQRLRQLLKSTDECGALISIIDCSKLFLSNFYVKGKKYYQNTKKTLSVLDTLRARAMELENGPLDEKYYYGVLEEIFRECWQALDYEVANINRTKEAGDDSYKSSLAHLVDIIENIVNSLGGILKYSIFDVSSCSELQSLATVLASCSNGKNSDEFSAVLKNVATTEKGRDLINKAERNFRIALHNITSEQKTPPNFM